MKTTTLTRRLKRETVVFGGALLVALVHAFDDALGEAGDHTLVAVLSLVLAAGAVWAFPRVRPGLRAGLALFFGAAATVNGSMHVKHIAEQSVAGGDVSGVFAAAAGGVLVALAIALPLVHRGEGSWKSRAVAVPATLLGFLLVIVPLSIGISDTHKWREDVGAAPSATYRDISFKASDGVQLSGWYRPTRNGATVIVVHGGGSDRRGSVAHASMLARHGYGVLLYDSRGRGRSEGTQNSWGWGWPRDIEGAIAYLKARPEVDPEQLGALGLSTGADAVVQVAGTRRDLKAVVADGTAASSYEDVKRVYGGGPAAALYLADFATVQILSGTKPGPTLEDVMPHVTSPMLMVAAGPQEKLPGEVYDRAAGDRPVDVWFLPNVSHTAAIREAAPEYERRITRFFEAALLR
jgi:hypothetical protein